MTSHAPEAFHAINLRRRFWLTIAIRTFVAHALPCPAEARPHMDRLDGQREARRVATNLTIERCPDGRNGAARWLFLETLWQQLELIWAVNDACAHSKDPAWSGLDLAFILALMTEKPLAIQTLGILQHELRGGGEVDAERFARALREPMRAIGKALLHSALSDDNPLLGLAFHRLMIYSDSLLLFDLSTRFFNDRATRAEEFLDIIGRAHLERQTVAEAIIALSWADGRIDTMERRLIKELIRIGRFNAEERKALRACLAGAPPTVEAIARGVSDPYSRRALLEELLLASFIDGDYSALEEELINALADAFGIDADNLLELELDVAAAIEANPQMLRGISPSGRVGRFGRKTTMRLEVLVRDNLEAIMTEIRETGDLASLLLKATHTELTVEEMAQVRSQLIDICKTIPALALFAVPGGSILVPILIKVLPFSMVPSAFEEKDEGL